MIILCVMQGNRPDPRPQQSASGEHFMDYWRIAQLGWAQESSNRPSIHELLSELNRITPQAISPIPSSSSSDSGSAIFPLPPRDAHEDIAEPQVSLSGDMSAFAGDPRSPSSPKTNPIRYHFVLVGTRLEYYSCENVRAVCICVMK